MEQPYEVTIDDVGDRVFRVRVRDQRTGREVTGTVHDVHVHGDAVERTAAGLVGSLERAADST